MKRKFPLFKFKNGGIDSVYVLISKNLRQYSEWSVCSMVSPYFLPTEFPGEYFLKPKNMHVGKIKLKNKLINSLLILLDIYIWHKILTSKWQSKTKTIGKLTKLKTF